MRPDYQVHLAIGSSIDNFTPIGSNPRVSNLYGEWTGTGNSYPILGPNLKDYYYTYHSKKGSSFAKKCFPKTEIVTDRFHVQKLASEAVQEERIRLRWKVIELENTTIQEARKNGNTYKTELLDNGDTHKQLLARSRYILFKPKTKWTKRQIEKAEILFKH